jgi:uncharacterized protein (DUF849 family)
VSARDLAQDSRAVAAAGAGAVHVHPRGHDGAETLDPEVVDDCVRTIRQVCPGLPIGVTTGSWIEPDPARRARLVGRWTEPDFASVNLSEPGHAEVMGALLEASIGIEAGIFTPGDVRRLTLSGFGEDVMRVLIEPGSGPEPVPDQVVLAAAIERALDAAAIRAPRLLHGAGDQTWAVVRAAVLRGRAVRIGLEDTLTGVDGRPAASNAALVRMTRKIVEGATPQA